MAVIMIVDDNSDVRMVVNKGLVAEGHHVIEAENGLDCLEKLGKLVFPDLILLDVMMPGMDGWEVGRRIKNDESLKNIPICMLTVKDSPEDVSMSIESVGAEWHLTKPVSIKKLNDIVYKILTLHDSAFYSTFKEDFFTANNI
jgi:CheY-like chemotaxis protein